MAYTRDQLRAEAEALETAVEDEALVIDPANVSQPNRQRSKMLTLRLTEDEYKSVQERAATEGLPVSAVVRNAVNSYITPRQIVNVVGKAATHDLGEAFLSALNAAGLVVVPRPGPKSGDTPETNTPHSVNHPRADAAPF